MTKDQLRLVYVHNNGLKFRIESAKTVDPKGDAYKKAVDKHDQFIKSYGGKAELTKILKQYEDLVASENKGK